MPSTVSSSAPRLTTPWRGAQPSVTSATSLTKTGVPSWVATRTPRMSSSAGEQALAADDELLGAALQHAAAGVHASRP